jgi:hypothetical protein
MVKAKWSGSYPCLCCGEWTLEVNGVDVSKYIPAELKDGEMNTYKTYERWYFGDDWDVITEDYQDGLMCNEWIEENKYWLDVITDDINIQREIFYAINEEDFRHGSCGGCI